MSFNRYIIPLCSNKSPCLGELVENIWFLLQTVTILLKMNEHVHTNEIIKTFGLKSTHIF